jgi:F0F1-type ATP synthase membrane subunit c/vacuolar-type H+-ATPase subunit K
MTVPVAFEAPWEGRLVALTVLLSALMLGSTAGVAWVALTRAPSATVRVLLLSGAVVPLAAFILGMVLAPRRYVIQSPDLVVQRWAGTVVIPLSSIRVVEPLPAERVSRSLRTLGSAGFFGYYGRFRNRALGDYRLYATRSGGYVLVEADRPYVLTPDAPARFIEVLNQERRALAGGPGA